MLYTLVAWGAGQLDNRLATRSFITQQNMLGKSGAEQTSVDAPVGVDLAEWSENRIAAWRVAVTDEGPEAFAMLSVPSAGISVPVFEGINARNLNAGVAWIDGTDEPGFDYGNTGIAGHRDGFFRGLQHVKLGEPIILRAGGEQLDYRISDISIVDPTDIETLLPRQEETITLVTCYPFYFVGHAPQRYVVQAVRQH